MSRQSTLFSFFSPRSQKNDDNERDNEQGPPDEKPSTSTSLGVSQGTSKTVKTKLSFAETPQKQQKKQPQNTKIGSGESENENASPHMLKRHKKDRSEDVPEKENGKKRLRPVIDSSDSESETPCKRPNTDPQTPKTNGSAKARKNNIIDSSESENEETSVKKNVKAFSFSKIDSDSSKRISTPAKTPVSKPIEIISDGIHKQWAHNNYEFLKPNKILDIKKRRPDHPEYDPRTLYVPDSFLGGLTPAMRQWWELKSKHFDTVLFFKVGKFYELYHMDAVVGVNHLGFCYMKGEFAHSGFPETAYAKMASCLIDKGFKVSRVEQTETPEMMTARCQSMGKTTKYDKVVKREICQVSTKATCIYTAQMTEAKSELPNFMYGICMEERSHGTFRFGICFVETSIGTFYLSEFQDDKHFSKMLTIFSEFPPALILTAKGGVHDKFTELLNCHFRDVRKESLLSKTQFYTADDTLEKLCGACYFRSDDGNLRWPEVFKKIANACIAKDEYRLSIRSLGACLWYLKDSKLDIHVFSMGKFEWYDPLDLGSSEKNNQKDYLILDAATINNLSLLGSKGSLKQTLDRCETPFGKRLLQRWICRPLCHVGKIKERQKAVMELHNNPTLLKSAQDILKKMPDLERQITKIHTYGNKFLSTDHPDSRAIFYEAVTYSKRKIKDFLKTLRAFEKAQEIAGIFKGCEDRLLRKITQFAPEGVNRDLGSTLDYFKTAFDQDEAEKEGQIIPQRGVEDEFDKVEMAIEEIKDELQEYLEEQSRFFGCKVSYFGNDKKRFQLEVPEKQSNKATENYLLEGTRKGNKPCKRFSTPMSRALLAKMMRAEAERAKLILDLNRRIFRKFSEKNDLFDEAVQCLTILDVLCSLAEYARTFSHNICMPEVLPFADKPKIEIVDGRHPCITNLDNFVANDTKMGVDNHPGILIITGPNMGGKSTLMRQIAVISVMAQMGSFVPATKCQLHLIDRIFTRLGAQDDIIQGQSTFYVELSEASCILQHASKHSLVLIDELGRGTSTHDGNAIAIAYVDKLTKIKCRTTFSTHYHSLVDNFIGNEDIQLGHMACLVENDDDPTQESVTFLYKVAEGRCPKSYGFNVARLAGLNHSIIVKARTVAKELEETSKLCDIFRFVFTSKEMSEVREKLASIVLN
ncbi:unnamed protein product [Phaedon cochleariae]|uniref:DNA mismatch repair protein n=1 Tax=Phaedon cochleariae TaxID=80249 RepID=A0A9N9SE04_PHACE|nr:unnamed protein product [Phaedon cochleariae]